MDLQQTINDFNKMDATIQTKYKKILSKIQEQKDRIDNIRNIYSGQSEEFIQNEIIKANNRIEKWTKEGDKFLKEQMEKSNKWRNKIEKDIEEQIQRAIKKILENII